MSRSFLPLPADQWVDDDSLDAWVNQVYEDWDKDPSHSHKWQKGNNCKCEAKNLIDEARRRRERFRGTDTTFYMA